MTTSLQEALFPEFTCWGCGQANPDGLHLRSFADGDDVIGSHIVPPTFTNGFDFVNGGIVSTLLDCHAGAVVLHRVLGDNPDGDIMWVTAGFEIAFRRPTPLSVPLDLHGHVESVDDAQLIIDTRLGHAGKDTATMRSTWKRFRPRGT